MTQQTQGVQRKLPPKASAVEQAKQAINDFGAKFAAAVQAVGFGEVGLTFTVVDGVPTAWKTNTQQNGRPSAA